MQNTNLISAEVVADSLNQYGERLTTLKLVFPRYVLAELNTHRLFSKNSASSRAIPFKKMVAQVMEAPFIPIAWQKDHKGMQGSEYLNLEKSDYAKRDWLDAKRFAVDVAQRMHKTGVTKQLCNRLLEPFMWTTMLITGPRSGWDNFFELKCGVYQDDTKGFEHISYKSLSEWYKNTKDLGADKLTFVEALQKGMNKGQAEIHIMDLAEKMWDAMNESKPKQLEIGAWHIPFGDQLDYGLLGDLSHNRTDEKSIEKLKLKVATARCARISYQTLGDNPAINYAKDIELHDMLLESGHFSPFEHCAQVMNGDEYFSHVKGIMKLDDMSIDDEYAYVSNGVAKPNVFGWSRNFKGFKQYRELLDEERRPEQTS